MHHKLLMCTHKKKKLVQLGTLNWATGYAETQTEGHYKIEQHQIKVKGGK